MIDDLIKHSAAAASRAALHHIVAAGLVDAQHALAATSGASQFRVALKLEHFFRGQRLQVLESGGVVLEFPPHCGIVGRFGSFFFFLGGGGRWVALVSSLLAKAAASGLVWLLVVLRLDILDGFGRAGPEPTGDAIVRIVEGCIVRVLHELAVKFAFCTNLPSS